MSNNTFRILRSAVIGATMVTAVVYNWPLLAGVLAVLFVLSL